MKRCALVRCTPMRSRSQVAEPAPRKPAQAYRLDRVVEPGAPVFRPQPKHEYVRSESLMRAYRALPCQHCGAEGQDAGVCGAHANWAAFGKGKGVKADDGRCASLCWECHRLLDQGKSWTDEMRMWIWGNAHVKTVRKLVALQLWPVGVAVPDTECVWALLGVAP